MIKIKCTVCTAIAMVIGVDNNKSKSLTIIKQTKINTDSPLTKIVINYVIASSISCRLRHRMTNKLMYELTFVQHFLNFFITCGVRKWPAANIKS